MIDRKELQPEELLNKLLETRTVVEDEERIKPSSSDISKEEKSAIKKQQNEIKTEKRRKLEKILEDRKLEESFGYGVL